MNCAKEWSRQFLANAFTNKFVTTTWKLNQQKLLFERERALLPATQALVEQLIAKEKIQEQIDEAELQYKALKLQADQMNKTIARLKRQRDEIGVAEVRTAHACPGECRGFLNEGKCGLCGKETCSECHVIKLADHVCQHDDLATARLLQSDTKPCPKCATSIFKISGCDQMWCTQCHTAFSWTHGHIQRSIHNPHFYEWQFLRPTGNALHNMPAKLRNIGIHIDQIDQIVQTTIHMRAVTIPDLRRNDNAKIRIAYMRNHISEKEFAVKIQRANTLLDRNIQIADLLHTFCQSVTDLIYRIYDEKQVHEIETLRTQLNLQLTDIAHTFHHKPISLSDFWMLIR